MFGAGWRSRLGVQPLWDTPITCIIEDWGCELAVGQLVFDGLI